MYMQDMYMDMYMCVYLLNNCVIYVHTYKTNNIYIFLVCAQAYPTLCDSVDCSMLRFPVLNSLLEFAQIHVHWVDDAI